MADIKKVSTHFLLMEYYLIAFTYTGTVSKRYWNMIRDELKSRKEKDAS